MPDIEQLQVFGFDCLHKMKNVIASILAFVSFMACAAAGSQEVGVSNDYVKSPKIHPISSHAMKTDELREFIGQYVLESSLKLDILWKNRRLFLALQDQPEVELIAVSYNSFVTATGATEVTFKQAANGNVHGVQLKTRK